MKHIAVILLAALVFMLSSCRFMPAHSDITTVSYIYEAETTAFQPTTEVTTKAEEQTSAQVGTTIQEQVETTQTKPNEENSSVAEKTTVKIEQTTKAPVHTSSAADDTTSVSLNIQMPEKNGTMVVDTSDGNKFIKMISKSRNINVNVLVAVYAVPESGQNYVFEFYNSTERSADDIKRVYLIDEKGEITGVAAANSSEREKISVTENWFCLNVLIKGVIYPAVKDDIS